MPTMKAALLTDTGEPLEITEVARPEPGEGQVLVKLQSCGVCHSDVHYWKGEDAIPDGRERVILGHEGVGTVAAGGDGTSLATGTRVGVGFVYSACGRCRECRTGGETYCQSSQATGVHVDGCFAEYVVAPESWVTHVPDSLDSSEAAPLLCAGVTAFSAVGKADLSPGKVAVVFGLGGVGLYAVQFAVLTGAKIVAIDFDDAKLELALQAGAVAALKPGDESTQQILAMGGADACLSFAPSPRVLGSEIEVAAPRATLVQVALPPQELSFHAAEIVDKGLKIIGSADGTRLERDTVMSLAEDGLVRSNVTAIPFHEINEAVVKIDRGTAVGRYVVAF